jgi:hypothetical protein
MNEHENYSTRRTDMHPYIEQTKLNRFNLKLFYDGRTRQPNCGPPSVKRVKFQ